ncbi:MAG: TIR domain-containing protein [Alphaproteobacteria bacterium]|nr:TIR domain-containing protein [Alphaproteobacteria bacterium]
MVKRQVFYSFHHENDAWRASQVRNMGVVEGNSTTSDNDWEEIKRGGNTSIQNWIDSQMKGRSCVVVLIGAETAGRRWINYEIMSAIDSNKKIIGIYIHNLKNSDSDGTPAHKGADPFPKGSDIKAYDPTGDNSQEVYSCIKNNIERWLE